MVFHKYPGRKYNLDGQFYWTEVEGVRWEVETSRRHRGERALWFAQIDDIPGSLLIAHSREELETKMVGIGK